ncbi:MAG: hypothetical protein QM704_24265 [Anaeromyxobacteraceae bacterium]
MNAKITWAAALAVLLAAPAVRAEEPAAAPVVTDPRITFWGGEAGRPGEETDSYTVPTWAPSGPLRLSGYTWYDVGYLSRNNTQSGAYDQGANYGQGRLVLGVQYRRELGALFAEARAQFVAMDNEFTKSQYEPHTQDAFLRIGQRTWDVQVGRFLGWEPYYRGMGFDRYAAEEAGALGGPPMHRLESALGYMDEPSQLAAHWYPAEWAALELGGVYGQQSEQNKLGIRPVLALRGYGFTFVGGYEYFKESPQADNNKVEQTTKGFSGRLQYRIANVTVGANATLMSVDATQIDGLVDANKTLDGKTFGGFAEGWIGDLLLGGGYHFTQDDLKKGDHDKHHQAFVAAQYKLPIEGLSVKAVVGFSRAQLQDVDANTAWENDLTSFRVRLRYDFR